jgi:hypothetical protein
VRKTNKDAKNVNTVARAQTTDPVMPRLPRLDCENTASTRAAAESHVITFVSIHGFFQPGGAGGHWPAARIPCFVLLLVG